MQEEKKSGDFIEMNQNLTVLVEVRVGKLRSILNRLFFPPKTCNDSTSKLVNILCALKSIFFLLFLLKCFLNQYFFKRVEIKKKF
jgi:hypothetical protein